MRCLVVDLSSLHCTSAPGIYCHHLDRLEIFFRNISSPCCDHILFFLISSKTWKKNNKNEAKSRKCWEYLRFLETFMKYLSLSTSSNLKEQKLHCQERTDSRVLRWFKLVLVFEVLVQCV